MHSSLAKKICSVVKIDNPGLSWEQISQKIIEIANKIKSISKNRREVFPCENLVYVLKCMGFRPDACAPGVDLERLTQKRTGNCVEISVLSILVGEHLGWQLHAKRVPNHMLVHTRANGKSINLEVLSFEQPIRDDDYYIKNYAIAIKQKESGIYLRDLSEDELAGEIISKLLEEKMQTGQQLSSKDWAMIQLSLSKNPLGIDIYNNVGLNYLLHNKYHRAELWFRRALDIDGNCISAANNLIETLIAQQKYQEAVSCEKSFNKYELYRVNLPPSLMQNFGKAHIRLGNYSRASQYLAGVVKLYQKVKIIGQIDLVRPYQACIAFFQKQFVKSASIALEWAKSDNKYEIGFVWALSAYLHSGMDKVRRRQLLEQVDIQDSYVSSLAHLFCEKITARELINSHPHKKSETACYLGEYFFRTKPKDALKYWNYCVSCQPRQTFEHLRAFRNLADTKRLNNATVPSKTLYTKEKYCIT